MPFLLKLPKLSPTMEEGTIAKWHKKVGDHVNEGDVIIEVATDKATVEYNALDEGYLRQILILEGQEASVNQPIAIFSVDPKENIEGFFKPETKKEPVEVQETIKVPEKEAPKTTAFTQPQFAPEPPLESYHFPYKQEEMGERVKASPLAKKMASEKGLDLASLKGSGPGGRIVKDDLENALPASDFSFGGGRGPLEKAGSYDEIPLTPIRKVIARRLQDSKTFIPHIYVQQEIDADQLYSFREQLKNLGLKVSINDCVVRGVALALRKHPEINTGFNAVNNTIIQFKTIDVAVAVSLESGLITPIVRYADAKNLGQISHEIHEMAKRARLGKLDQSEYKGGSFTVSNLGMFGVSSFAAIINPPQAAILAVSGIKDKAVIKNGHVVPGKTMMLTLSTDHRVIDGVPAAQFLNTLKSYLENPASLLLYP